MTLPDADPVALARLHAAAMEVPRPWSAADFAALMGAPGVFLRCVPHGFALGRAVLDEAELLTLAVDPAARRRGHGRAALTAFETAAQQGGARVAHLEVSAENIAARALYAAAGWEVSGQRRGYYDRPGGGRIDAIAMRRMLSPA
ncbi:GNAT family N-acetyltransferase [Mesobaculum littorinae]|uniref:GNAT family N-acetyltransferase n=1 Tax=Mesobaculum littorinae TaxID=2486419 RepID=A0A438AD98_9RHOB|nr:GNAT family N-acetyltransferase [Mesobaculum littorinae]RVV96659.1 GNAT family N-acetyltransferase [Mesobaculum littorinae]